MDGEEPSSCSSSSTEYHHHHRRRSKSKTKHRTDPLNASFSHSHTSSFDPSSSFIQNNMEMKKAPIIIEKVVPNPMITTHQKYSLEQPEQSFNPIQQTDDNYSLFSDTYQINERGEKITKEGNRIVFMDVIQPDTINNNTTSTTTELQPYKPPRSHRKRSKHIPVIDLRSVENLLKKSKSKSHRKNDDNDEIPFENDHLSTSDMLEIVEGYFEDYKGRKLKLDSDDAQAILAHFESSHQTKHRQTSNPNNHHHHHRRRTHSTLTAGPGVNYVERPSIRPKSIESQQQPIPSVLNNEQVGQYVSNIYGTPKNPSQPSSPISPHEPEPSNDVNQLTTATNLEYISPFRYMQSSMNPLLLREYRNNFQGIQ
jgi:hypothetical protein